MKLTHKTKSTLGLICCTIIVMGFLYSYFLQHLDGIVYNPPLTFKSNPLNLKTDKLVYHVGDTVSMEVDFCKHRNLAATVQWNLVDSFLLLYPQREGGVSVGCYTVTTPVQMLPKLLPSGTYHFEGTAVYHINSYRDVVYRMKTQDFRVIQ